MDGLGNQSNGDEKRIPELTNDYAFRVELDRKSLNQNLSTQNLRKLSGTVKENQNTVMP